MNRHFMKENIQMANKQMKICSTSLVVKMIKIKTTMKDYFIPVIMAKIKKTINTKHWTGYETTGELS